MMHTMRRRSGAICVTWWLAGLAVAGCAGAPISQSRAAAEWPMFHAAATRVGTAAAGLPLTGSFHVAWTYRPEGQTNGFLDWGPIVAKGVVYTPDGLNHIVALDAASGRLLWAQKMISNAFTVTYATEANILLATTAITTTATPTLFALNPATGEQLWDNMINGQPAIGGVEGAPAVRGNRVFVNYLMYEGSGGVCAYEIATGRLVWQRKLPKESSYSPVAADHERVYVGSESGHVYALRAATGEIAWSFQSPAKPLFSAPTLVGDRVLVAAGTQMLALNASTGAVVWQQSLGGETGSSSPAVDLNRLYVGTRKGTLVALELTRGERVWETDLGAGAIDSSPAVDVATGRIVVGSAANTVCVVEAQTGRVSDRVRLSNDERGNWKNSPAITGGRIYIGSLDKTFYALTNQ